MLIPAKGLSSVDFVTYLTSRTTGIPEIERQGKIRRTPQVVLLY